MKNQNILALVLAIILLASCQEKKASQPAEEQTRATIEQLEEKLFEGSKTKFNDAIAKQLIALYIGYADANPSDTLSPEYLFRAGELSVGVEEYDKGIGLFDKIYKGYPDYNKRVEALFMVAFTYDEHLKRKGQAADIYDKLIQKHPDHHFAEVSKQVLETLSMSEEELLKKFQSNQHVPNS